MGFTVAVTGPTGQVGIPAVSSLERETQVDKVLGMARRPFDPATLGWAKTEYRQGDILDRGDVDGLVADADVVVHLAFRIMGSRQATRRLNVDGSRNVFESVVAHARPSRLVYTSSVAAYGYHRDNPLPLTEDVPARGSPAHYYSHQKAELEGLLDEVTSGSGMEVYVLRPSIVAGPRATALADFMPWNSLGPMSGPLVAAGRAVPLLRPPMPDPGIRLQLVHHDDLAAAIVAAVLGRGAPGAYNIAGDGEVSLSDVARALGGRGIRVPRLAAIAATDVIGLLPWAPWLGEWLNAGRVSVVMDTSKAKGELGWVPEHTTAQTLGELARVGVSRP